MVNNNIKIDVFQSELNKNIKLEYIGKLKYVGETFGVDGLTDGVTYNVVKDKYGTLKVVDDSGEDYIYDFVNPRPVDNSSKGGIFVVIDDPQEELKRVISFTNPD